MTLANPLPPTGPLTDWLRREAQEPFEQPRGDVGDQFPMQWLTQAVRTDPDLAKRVAAAVEDLLGEGDALVSSRVIGVASESPEPLKSALLRAVGRFGSILASLRAEFSTRSLLGEAVGALYSARLEEDPTDAALSVLKTIAREEDGWPQSVALGVRLDLDQFADQLLPTLERLDEKALRSFVGSVLARGGDRVVQPFLEHLRSEATLDLRARIGRAISDVVDELAASRRALLDLGYTLSEAEEPTARWTRYMNWLGIPT